MDEIQLVKNALKEANELRQRGKRELRCRFQRTTPRIGLKPSRLTYAIRPTMPPPTTVAIAAAGPVFHRSIARFNVEKGQPFTHTSIGDPKFSVYVPVDDEAAFYAAYTEALRAGEVLHMTEKPRDIGPMVMAFKFDAKVGCHVSDANDARIVNCRDPHPKLAHSFFAKAAEGQHKSSADNLVKTVINVGFHVLETFVAFEDNNVDAYVLRKPQNPDDGKNVYNFEVVIPDVVMEPAVRELVRKKMLLELGPAFNEAGIIDAPDKCFDEAVG
jgi:hypothetical protein